MITLVVIGVKTKAKAMDYSKFQVEDFVTDEYFVRWVKKPDPENNAFWNAWMSKNPQCAERIRAAREIVLQLDFKPNIPPEGKFLEVWDKIVKADSNDLRFTPVPSPRQQKKVPNRKAVVLDRRLRDLAGYLFYLVLSVRPRKLEISTAYGESRTLSLPDSTKVTLNSNSKISYSSSLFSDGSREVFLEEKHISLSFTKTIMKSS